MQTRAQIHRRRRGALARSPLSLFAVAFLLSFVSPHTPRLSLNRNWALNDELTALSFLPAPSSASPRSLREAFETSPSVVRSINTSLSRLEALRELQLRAQVQQRVQDSQQQGGDGGRDQEAELVAAEQAMRLDLSDPEGASVHAGLW